MKAKDLILNLGLALLGMWLLQNLFWSNKTTNTNGSGSEFIAPTMQNKIEPLNYHVDFDDSQSPIDLDKIQIDTNYASIDFSNQGGVIDSISYKNIFSDKDLNLNVLPSEFGIKNKAFLVALKGIGSTPLYYNLISNQRFDLGTKLVYQAKTDIVDIVKEFIVYNDDFKIDLNLTISPVADLIDNRYLEARIFFPSPKLISSDSQNIIQGIIYGDQNKLIKKSIQSVTNRGWISPSIFGTEDRFFVNALVNSDNFLRRAYFEEEGSNRLVSVLEGPKIKESKTWNLRFYFGPKKSTALASVDSRLESVVEYGWLWFLSKPILYILNWLYEVVGNYGWAIVIFAAFIKLLFLPFSWKFDPHKMKKQQEEYNKKMKYIEHKFRHDKEALMREQLALIKKQGMFGGMIGLFGQQILVQFPIFIALRRVLQHSLEFYNAPFLWIPDLSNFDPYYILPVLFGMGMILSMMMGGKFEPRKFLFHIIIMLVATAFMTKVSSGLMLYFVVGVFIGVIQSYLQKVLK